MAARPTRTIGRPDDLVGVRELRQNLSVYLKRVMGGETLRVADRERPVAVFAPLPAAATVVERLVASGRAIGARGRLDDLPPLPRHTPKDLGARAQRALEELRADIV